MRALTLAAVSALSGCCLAAMCLASAPGGSGPGWPYWKGPCSTGAAPDRGLELVDDLAKARLVWKSAEWVPGTEGHLSGFASPVVSDGRVYVYYYLGAEGFEGEAFFRPRNVPPDKVELFYSPAADDVILCLDAETGRTIWKTVFRGVAINCQGSGKAGGHSTPCAAYGNVYAVGTTGRVYCLAADTGEPVWQSHIGTFHWNNEAARAQQIRLKKVWFHKRRYYLPSNAPVFAGGVVAVGDHHNLHGFDAQTGRRLWVVPGSMCSTNTPLRWMPAPAQEGSQAATEYFIATARGRTTCIEARTGRVCWRAPTPHTPFGPPAVTGSRLLCMGNHKVGVGLNCHRISPKNAKLMWKLPPELRGATDHATPVVYRGHVYLSCTTHNAEGRSMKFPWICVELETGRIVGRFVHRGGGAYSTLAAEGRLIGQEGFMASADPQDFRMLSRRVKAWDYADSTSPAYADGRLYFRGNRAVYCYDLRAKP